MNWEEIKDFILAHKQYVIAGLIVTGIVIWTKVGNAGDANQQNTSDFNEVASTTTADNKAATKDSDTEPAKTQSEPTKTQTNSEVTCDISGAVKKQGVYTLKTGARLQELIEAAGGTAENAQLKHVNRALILQDQDKVHIPYRGEKIKADDIISSVNGTKTSSTSASADTTTSDGANTSGKINLNTATAADLQKLNGIGEKKAEQIIAYREKSGQFKKIEDLKEVSGIGDKTFAALKDQLEV
ncbi:helix-hairpin-helix domain-containing protein [Lactobacillus sp. ESL0681]|uniref:helix-hairpin-helix domain-containing protein n=1 Tax=Lactobacillus sp. ESL0681 TaxID=2983211 RepID=UPI0023F639D6|nr:helix-hairpin-helix domain-containing protein [Lactobacillus sp. ESL0681]WEV40615.1 helix-hairpin-helix domain-containing protein [Lactobacillus sp. ESL0681]